MPPELHISIQAFYNLQTIINRRHTQSKLYSRTCNTSNTMNNNSNAHHYAAADGHSSRQRHSIAIQVDGTRNNSDCSERQVQLLHNQSWRIHDTDISEVPELYPRLSYPLIVPVRRRRRLVTTTSSSSSSDGNSNNKEEDVVDNNNNDDDVVDTISLIGKRLSDFLVVNNIRSVYDSQRGRVFCSSPRVSFVVQFWRQKKPSAVERPTATPTTATEQRMMLMNTTNRDEVQKCSVSSGTGTGIDAVATTTTMNMNMNMNATEDCQEDDEEKEEEIILEIQRRQGCSYSMQKIRTALKKSILSSLSLSSSSSSSNDCDSNHNNAINHHHMHTIQYAQQSYKPSVQIKKMMRQKRFSAPPRQLVAPQFLLLSTSNAFVVSSSEE